MRRDVVIDDLAAVGPGGRKFVVVIGINAYRSHEPLRNAVSDARGISEFFTTQLGFEQPIDPLFDADATRDALQILIRERLRKLVCSEDELVLFYAGHGLSREDLVADRTEHTGFLVPVDAHRENWADYIDVQHWLDHVSKLPARHIFVILDACHSGMAIGRETVFSRNRGPSPATVELQRRASRRVLVSAMNNQTADDYGPLPNHSLFTGALLQELRVLGENATVSEVSVAARRAVIEYSHSRQTPDFGSFRGDEGGEMVLALPRLEQGSKPSPARFESADVEVVCSQSDPIRSVLYVLSLGAALMAVWAVAALWAEPTGAKTSATKMLTVPNRLTLAPGESAEVSLEFLPQGTTAAGDYDRASSSDPEVAYAKHNVVNAVAVGEARVTWRVADLEASVDVRVVRPEISLYSGRQALRTDETTTISAEILLHELPAEQVRALTWRVEPPHAGRLTGASFENVDADVVRSEVGFTSKAPGVVRVTASLFSAASATVELASYHDAECALQNTMERCEEACDGGKGDLLSCLLYADHVERGDDGRRAATRRVYEFACQAGSMQACYEFGSLTIQYAFDYLGSDSKVWARTVGRGVTALEKACLAGIEHARLQLSAACEQGEKTACGRCPAPMSSSETKK